jgi:flagellar motor switch protein FliM
VQDVTKFHASPGAFKGQKAIRIEDAVPTEKANAK